MTDSQHSIHEVASLFDFFHSELSSAFDSIGLTTSDETENYLVCLLEGFVRLDAQSARDVGFERPAAFILGDALESAGEQRIEAYRRLGDASLFSCGFFERHLNRDNSVVSLKYYRNMGRNAYSNLESLMEFKAPGGAFHRIYDELTAKFDTVVEAFQMLANKRRGPSYSRLVEQWERDGHIDLEAWDDIEGLPGGSGGTA